MRINLRCETVKIWNFHIQVVSLLATSSLMENRIPSVQDSLQEYPLVPVGYVRSCFKTKNGTPRQPSVCSYARAKLTIMKSVFNQPEHSLQGLEQFSHLWLIYIFHQNENLKFTKAKIKPPRLDGEKVGVFACRSPYRRNPIGLTLAKIEEIKGNTIHLSGVDIVDGTPVLDIKPFIPEYDQVAETQRHKEVQVSESGRRIHSDDDMSCNVQRTCEGDLTGKESPEVSVPDWIESPTINQLTVRFTPHAEQQLKEFTSGNQRQLEFFKDEDELRQAICDILAADPRSTFRRNQCQDKLYFFPIDNVHVTCWFGDDFAEVVRVQSVSKAKIPVKDVS